MPSPSCPLCSALLCSAPLCFASLRFRSTSLRSAPLQNHTAPLCTAPLHHPGHIAESLDQAPFRSTSTLDTMPSRSTPLRIDSFRFASICFTLLRSDPPRTAPLYLMQSRFITPLFALRQPWTQCRFTRPRSVLIRSVLLHSVSVNNPGYSIFSLSFILNPFPFYATYFSSLLFIT